MKTKIVILSSLLLFAILLLSAKAFSQDKKVATIKIKTSAVCDMCKERIEQAMAFEKGVKTAVLDVDTKIVTITYNPSKTTPDDLRKAISKLGYDADNVAKDKAAYAKLPACCKVDAAKKK
ncbi:MAG: heavy metal-associated domain-containing protein [Bacteroidetes bacterium]|nr:heavy metal-associated domain-containing protein [Bacteroidota bacterium]